MSEFASGGLIDAIRIRYPVPLTKGDRVRIKEGYDRAGFVGFYVAKSFRDEGFVIVDLDGPLISILAEAIEPYPYTKDERVERAIEDYEAALRLAVGDNGPLLDDDRAILYAILDAGI